MIESKPQSYPAPLFFYFLFALALAAFVYLAFLILEEPGHSLTYLYENQWGEKGDAPGQFTEITNLAFGPDGCLYVGDWYNCRI